MRHNRIAVSNESRWNRQGRNGRMKTPMARTPITSNSKFLKLFTWAALLSIPCSWNYHWTFEILQRSEQVMALRNVEPALMESNNSHSSSLLIVTAFSQNHMLESVKMMKSLISMNYTGPLAIYLLKQTNEAFTEELAHSFPKTIRKSPLNVVGIQYMNVEDEFETYCFKAHVIHDVLQKQNPDILMWADTSVEFEKNPQLIADEMDESGLELFITEGTMGMGHNTYNETAAWFGLDRRTFHEKREIQSGLWFALVRDKSDDAPTSVFQEIVQPYVDCGIDHCRECMAPGENLKSIQIGRKRIREHGEKYEGVHPPGKQFIAHRQDQSVLSLLVHKYIRSHTQNSAILIVPKFSNGYMHAERGTSNNFRIEDLLS